MSFSTQGAHPMQQSKNLKLVILIPLFLMGCTSVNSTDNKKIGSQVNAPSVLSSVDSSPLAIEQPLPSYPAKAHALSESGRVTVRYSITEAGLVDNVHIVESTPSGVFDREVLYVMRKWRFKSGNPIDNVESRFVFSLKDGSKFLGAPVVLKSGNSN